MKIEEFQKRGLMENYYTDIEFTFLKVYFATTILLIISTYSEIPCGIIGIMQKKCKELFPTWEKNELLNNCEELRKVCELVEYPLVQGNMEEVVMALADIFKT